MSDSTSEAIVDYISELLCEAVPSVQLSDESIGKTLKQPAIGNEPLEKEQLKKAAKSASVSRPSIQLPKEQASDPKSHEVKKLPVKRSATRSVASDEVKRTKTNTKPFEPLVPQGLDGPESSPEAKPCAPKRQSKSSASFDGDGPSPSDRLQGGKRQQLEKLLQPSLKVGELSAKEPFEPALKQPLAAGLSKVDIPGDRNDTAMLNGHVTPVPLCVEAEKSNADSLTEPGLPVNKSAPILDRNVVEPNSQASTQQEHQDKPEDPLLVWSDNGRPKWAEARFDVLLFKVAGLTLAVPLVALGHIHMKSEGFTPIFGQTDWFMGLQPSPDGPIRCINTALFVMPERYDSTFVDTAKLVISINGTDWGLAVDSVQQPTSIEPEDVTWRTERSKRPWLAGTVKAAMCALIDVPRMGFLLEQSDVNRV